MYKHWVKEIKSLTSQNLHKSVVNNKYIKNIWLDYMMTSFDYYYEEN